MAKKIYCSRRFTFDAGHRIIGHKGKCSFLHGHRYVCEATFAADQINELGMIIDFGTIKEQLGTWINENLDHNLILSNQDKSLARSVTNCTKQRIYTLHANPTSENIALHLLNEVCPKLFASIHVTCIKIKLYESENSFVEVSSS